ncbi:MAG: NADH-quinone oxidoreductase subunit NuoH [Bacteroidales bacterium]
MIKLADIVQWIHQWLTDVLPAFLATIAANALGGIAILSLVLVCVIICVYMERKVAAFMQLRLGPMRVGKWGSLQVLADVIKLLLKESFVPTRTDKILFVVAPVLVLTVSLMALAPVSFSDGVQMWDMNIGVLYITAISSLGVIGVLMAGWASNNKFSLVGAMRAGAQIISYELSAALSILAIVAMTGTLSMNELVQSQADGWWIFKGHLPAMIAFVFYVIAATAECNRAPFDLAEAEQELTAGYHTEYSGMQFGMFYLTEYINMIVVSIIASTLFLGGWQPFHIYGFTAFNTIMDYIPQMFWLMGKVFFIIFLMMWFRWTFPRLRIDQLLKLEWKYLMPISLVNLVIAALCTVMGWHF